MQAQSSVFLQVSQAVCALSLSSSVLPPAFFPSTSNRNISPHFFLLLTTPKTLAVKGSMMKPASPTLFSPCLGLTHPSQLHLRHKDTHFQLTSTLCFSPLTSTSLFLSLLFSTTSGLSTFCNTILLHLQLAFFPIIHQPCASVCCLLCMMQLLSFSLLNSITQAPPPSLQGK